MIRQFLFRTTGTSTRRNQEDDPSPENPEYGEEEGNGDKEKGSHKDGSNRSSDRSFDHDNEQGTSSNGNTHDDDGDNVHDGDLAIVAPAIVVHGTVTMDGGGGGGTASTTTHTTTSRGRQTRPRLLPKMKMDWTTRLTCLLIMILLLAIIAIGVMVWNMQRQNAASTGTTGSTSGNGNHKNLLPLPQYYDLLFQHLSQVRHVQGLTDPQTDAYKTLEWMAFEDGAVQQLLDTSTAASDGSGSHTLHVPAVEQRVAIAMFFFATAGADFWNTQWLLPGKQECTLDGITCDADADEDAEWPHITRIELVERSLLGTLPSELAWLSQLQRLDVHQNRLYGTLPVQFFQQWTRLEYLDVSFNAMTGTLPSDWTALSHLTDFAAQLNSFQGSLPKQLPLSLLHFSVDGNRLSGTIPWSDWKESMDQQLQQRHQQGRDWNTATTTNATTSSNATPTLDSNDPPGHALTVLDLGSNGDVTGIVSPWIATIFPQLVSLGLYRTKVHGTLPSELGQLRHLEQVSLAGSTLTGTLPTSLYQLSTLQWFVAASTQLGGTLSTHIGQWSSLQVLNLVDTMLSGTLPTQLGLLSNTLEWLQLSDSNIAGTIPTELGQLSKLSRLWLHNTQLTGVFPTQACQVLAIQDDLRLDCHDGSPISCSCCNYCF